MVGAEVLLVEDLEQQRLGARSLAAVLEGAGLRARLVDWRPGQSPEGAVALAQALQPRLVVLSVLFAHGVPEHLALATALRRSGVGAHCTMAGPLPTFAWRELLLACPALDSVLRGEAEAGVAALAAGLDDAAAWQATPGLAYRAPALRANPLPAPPSLDRLPSPLYEEELAACGGAGFATVEASRGCYHNCAFCLPHALHRATGPTYRLRSVERVLDEIEALYQRGARLFLFDDEQFLPPGRPREARVAALAEGLERRGLDIAFTCKCRADDVEPGLFRWLQAMGLLRVYIGVESGHAPTLALLGKGVTPAQNAAALADLDRLGIVADFRSLLFHPWTTLESLHAELAWLERILPSVPTCFCFRELEVYPGTPIAARLPRGGVLEPWPLPYAITDPRAELLRRLGRLVFGPTGQHAHLQARVTQAWYEILLQRRFRLAEAGAGDAATLRALVAQANAAALATWREMLAFAEAGDIYDATLVNEHAAGWAAHISACCAQADARLDHKEASHA